jgi:hypothetical protein
MVRILTSPTVPMVKGQVRHCGHVKHCMEMLNLCIYLLAVLRQQRSELVDDHLGGQGTVARRAIDLLALPVNPTGFLVKHPRVVLE